MLTSKNAAIQPKQSNHNRPESTKSHNTAPPHTHTHMHMIQSCTRNPSAPTSVLPIPKHHTPTHRYTLGLVSTHLREQLPQIRAKRREGREREQFGWEVCIKRPKKRNFSFSHTSLFQQEMAITECRDAALLLPVFLLPLVSKGLEDTKPLEIAFVSRSVTVRDTETDFRFSCLRS